MKSAKILVAVALWLFGIEVAAEAWYRSREQGKDKGRLWTVIWPTENETFKFAKVPEEARSILRYSSGESAVVSWPSGSSWQIFYFQWQPGKASSQLARMHRPEICLPAAGFQFLSRSGTVTVATEGVDIPFEPSVFLASETPMFVFRCLWEDHQFDGVSQPQHFDMSVAGRLQSAWFGQRNLGQRLLQIGIIGPKTELEAIEELNLRLPGIIKAVN